MQHTELSPTANAAESDVALLELDDITVVSGRRAPQPDGVSLPFEREVLGLGRLFLRPFRLPADMPVVHGWLRQSYAAHFGLVGKSLDQAAAVHRELMQSSKVYLGYHQERPQFLLESYDPAHSALSSHYPARPGDRGLNLLVAPPIAHVSTFIWSVLQYVMDFLFSDASIRRIVVAPDAQNAPIHALNRRAGFLYGPLISLPDKTAHLAFCDRAHYAAAIACVALRQGALTEKGSHEAPR